MATLSVIEINHNCVRDLQRKGHISPDFALWLTSPEYRKRMLTVVKLEGLTYIAQRHHSDTLDLKVSG